MTFVWPTSHLGMLHPLEADGSAVRQRALEFLQFADASRNGIGYARAKTLFKVSRNQAETRKALYQEFGLLYVERGTDILRLTPIGGQLLDLLGTTPNANQPEDVALQVDALLSWALSNCQINRPGSPGSPLQAKSVLQSCTIKPYATFWQAMRDLQGYISETEFLQALATLHDVNSYDAVIASIQASRASGKPLPQSTSTSENYSIYWKSHLTVARKVLAFDEKRSVFEFRPERREIIAAILDLHLGCNGKDVRNAIAASPWATPQEYYQNIGGLLCPPFLAKGQVRILDVAGQTINVLKGYTLYRLTNYYTIEGGPELCRLSLKAACFHESEQSYLLRLDRKVALSATKTQLIFGQGRPITSVQLLKKLLEF